MSLGLLLLLVISALLALLFENARRKRMLTYTNRSCQSVQWQRHFSMVPSDDIRAFLTLFVNAFALGQKRLPCFSPDDCLLDIYRTIYTPGGLLTDAMELEILALEMERSYHVDVLACWHENITLGQIFALTLHPAK